MIKPIQTKPEPYCPECGAKMILIKPPPKGSSWDAFWGCSQYPDCKGTRNIGSDGKPETDEWDQGRLMDNSKPPPTNNGSAALIELLNSEQIQLLARLLTEVIADTGHGRVQLIIVDKRVKHLRSEKSY